MKSFKNCPCCGDPLVNDIVTSRNNNEAHRRSCFKKVDHKFTTNINPQTGELLALGIEIDMKEMVRVQWNFETKTLSATKGPPKIAHQHAVILPWFEPDLSNYQRLLTKLRTYVTFS